ncbi:phosphoglucomutase/phosphomannomutase family protein [Halosimplex halophilum]|uniref:phosphoglucomutase/phosphomannomutase family protein n=1 Tax=Halosimplex halophilum TaxID=2559572 RepID=UPI00107FD321|nr:phosphoglucomutase/phosphomannomutase family protein [Halosimplex halophilum]
MTADADADAIEFGTDGWRATLDEFTEPRVRMVGQAVATYLREDGDAHPDAADGAGTVAVGYDARDTSRGFAEELARVLAANGFDVLVPPRDCPTPVVAWTVRQRDLAGGLMVTASHNPPEYNGVKFLPAGGAPALPEVTDALADRLAEPDPLPESEWGSVAEADLVGPYTDRVLDAVDADLSGLSVVYDAMHGSGRGVTDLLLERAGADVDRLRCERDPEFGGDSPEPTAAHLGDLADRVAESDADLGVANDGDADRIAVVTPDRGVLDPNLFFAATYEALLDEGVWTSDEETSGDVVRTVSTSSIVDRVAEAHGQSVHETAVGFKWVAQAMADHDALMGGEESGGFGLTTHVRNKDGVGVAVLAAAVAAAEPYDDRVDALLERHGAIVQDRVSVDCPDERKGPVLSDLEDALPDELAGSAVEDVSTVDGFKAFLADGTWLLMRPSGTEPKLRVYAEASSQERVDELLAAGRELVEPLV